MFQRFYQGRKSLFSSWVVLTSVSWAASFPGCPSPAHSKMGLSLCAWPSVILSTRPALKAACHIITSVKAWSWRKHEGRNIPTQPLLCKPFFEQISSMNSWRPSGECAYRSGFHKLTYPVQNLKAYHNAVHCHVHPQTQRLHSANPTDILSYMNICPEDFCFLLHCTLSKYPNINSQHYKIVSTKSSLWNQHCLWRHTSEHSWYLVDLLVHA